MRTRAAELCELMMPEFAARWRPVLMQILAEFVEASRGNVNHEFWQCMCKKVQHGQGSGSYESVSGWITMLYPHIDGGGHLRGDWRETLVQHGPQPDDFPQVVSSTPVEWNYHGTKHSMHFHAGALGITQDVATGALQPVNGWIISHDPPVERAERRAQLLQEIADIEAGLGGAEPDRRTLWWLQSARKEAQDLAK